LTDFHKIRVHLGVFDHSELNYDTKSVTKCIYRICGPKCSPTGACHSTLSHAGKYVSCWLVCMLWD